MPGTSNKTYVIHPAIGIARMGNAPLDIDDTSTYFIGAESPYQIPNEGESYKKNGKIRKQAQRFRIFEYEDGIASREITLTQADIKNITWHVQVGNRKAALLIDDAASGSISAPTHRPQDFHPSTSRNTKVIGDARKGLCIDSGLCSIDGNPGQNHKELVGKFSMPYKHEETNKTATTQVQLGSIYSEKDTGRLLYFAGNGLSEGLDVETGQFSEKASLGGDTGDFANNDYWYDQSCDGPIRAEIVFTNGQSVKLEQPEHAAWILCSLPKYTPAFNYFTNLQHVALSAAFPENQSVPRPSFANDIFPILRSVSQLQWVSARGSLGHGTGRQGYYLSRRPVLSDNNTDPTSDAYKARDSIFKRLRNPFTLPSRPDQKLTLAAVEPRQMPELPGDERRSQEGHDWALPSVTKLQFSLLEKWRDGDFDPDPDGVYDYVHFDSLKIAEQPAALDSAALEGSCGTPFYPGIESWNVLQLKALYSSPLRINPDVKPGDLTMGNALPWQSDYLDCNDGWWPIQRPNHVTRNGKVQQPWAPDEWVNGENGEQYSEMVENWWRLGFILSKDNNATFEEYERNIED